MFAESESLETQVSVRTPCCAVFWIPPLPPAASVSSMMLHSCLPGTDSNCWLPPPPILLTCCPHSGQTSRSFQASLIATNAVCIPQRPRVCLSRRIHCAGPQYIPQVPSKAISQPLHYQAGKKAHFQLYKSLEKNTASLDQVAAGGLESQGCHLKVFMLKINK